MSCEQRRKLVEVEAAELVWICAATPLADGIAFNAPARACAPLMLACSIALHSRGRKGRKPR
jgi:hypothetical protein